MAHDTQNAQILQKQDEWKNIYAVEKLNSSVFSTGR